MLDRKNSLQGVEREFELLVEKATKLQKELAACESKCQGCPNTVELDKTKSIVTTLIASLRDVETNL
jgi:hypothetical protein